MARIKLEIPDRITGTFSIPVRIADINYGNHVGNDAFVSIIHEARMQWLSQYGYTELKIEGIGLIMSDLVLEFKQESFYGDTVQIELAVAEISRVGFDLYYRLTTKRNDENMLLANAKTGMICYDYDLKKVVAIPQNLKQVLEA
jgi:YbgC/YbaW family acyl-CoA thioester hydrolase